MCLIIFFLRVSFIISSPALFKHAGTSLPKPVAINPGVQHWRRLQMQKGELPCSCGPWCSGLSGLSSWAHHCWHRPRTNICVKLLEAYLLASITIPICLQFFLVGYITSDSWRYKIIKVNLEAIFYFSKLRDLR